jgi:hypothetical protein
LLPGFAACFHAKIDNKPHGSIVDLWKIIHATVYDAVTEAGGLASRA